MTWSTHSHSRMCLVLENMPYYQQQPIHSIQIKSNNELLEIMEEFNIDVLSLPWMDVQWGFYNSLDNDNDSIVDQGEFMEIIFDKNAQSS